MNIPNMLTTIRLILVPLFPMVFFSDMKDAALISFLIFLASGLTDMLDGYIARKYDLITKWGTVLDPLADKLMSLTVLMSLTIKEAIPVWVLLIIGTKELLMIIAGAALFKKDICIPSNIYGKAATVLFYIAVAVLELINRSLGLILIYLTVFVTLFALYNYVNIFKDIKKEHQS